MYLTKEEWWPVLVPESDPKFADYELPDDNPVLVAYLAAMKEFQRAEALLREELAK